MGVVRINANIINNFIQGIESTLSSMGASCTFNALSRDQYPQDDELLVASLIDGQATGKYIIGMPHTTFMLISELFQVPGMDDTEMKRSFLNEIGSMVVGHSITNLQQSGVSGKLVSINSYDSSNVPEYMKRASCFSVELMINNEHPLRAYFVLGDDYRKYEVAQKLYHAILSGS
jgi:CheY-specific phosphatase CheX